VALGVGGPGGRDAAERAGGLQAARRGGSRGVDRGRAQRVGGGRRGRLLGGGVDGDDAIITRRARRRGRVCEIARRQELRIDLGERPVGRIGAVDVVPGQIGVGVVRPIERDAVHRAGGGQAGGRRRR